MRRLVPKAAVGLPIMAPPAALFALQAYKHLVHNKVKVLIPQPVLVPVVPAVHVPITGNVTRIIIVLVQYVIF